MLVAESHRSVTSISIALDGVTVAAQGRFAVLAVTVIIVITLATVFASENWIF